MREARERRRGGGRVRRPGTSTDDLSARQHPFLKAWRRAHRMRHIRPVRVAGPRSTTFPEDPGASSRWHAHCGTTHRPEAFDALRRRRDSRRETPHPALFGHSGEGTSVIQERVRGGTRSLRGIESTARFDRRTLPFTSPSLEWSERSSRRGRPPSRSDFLPSSFGDVT